MRVKRLAMILIVVVTAATAVLYAFHRQPQEPIATAVPTPESSESGDVDQQPTMSDVLDMAQEALEYLSETLHDYTARLVKQERDRNGQLTEETTLFMKVQTRFRTPDKRAPKRVYLRFEAPESVKGREVIWGEDLYDGKMAVHEVGLVLGLKTHWLDPTGMIAMAGQRYPISEIGIERLVEKLIERGEKDRDNPDITVTMTDDDTFPDLDTQLIRVRRAKPGGGEDDFSLAEIIFDRQRKLILRYRSFGWPDSPDEPRPLIESYTYHDVQTNVGLTDADFDYRNPEYGFPAF